MGKFFNKYKIGCYLLGLDKLQKKLEFCCEDLSLVEEVVRKNGNQLNERMKTNMRDAYIKGYSTGDTAGSVNTTIRSNYIGRGYTALVGPTTEYALYVEYGTRLMKAEPAIRPAWEVQNKIFKRDLEAIMQ